MPIVVHSQILRVHAAAVTVGLVSSRDALLAGVPSALTASFPTASNPSAQLLSDLDRLNDLGSLADGSLPLQIWLDNAMALSSPRDEAEVFRQVHLLATSTRPIAAPSTAKVAVSPQRTVPPVTKAAPPPAHGPVGALQSTFISYGAPDQAFAERLDAALHRRGVQTFLFTRDAVPGQKLHRAMRQGVNEHDRVIVICSARSLDRLGVRNEIEETLTREARDGGASYLIPITLDDYVFSGWAPPDPRAAQAVRDRVVADFRGAETDSAKFDGDVTRLIEALRIAPRQVLAESPRDEPAQVVVDAKFINTNYLSMVEAAKKVRKTVDRFAWDVLRGLVVLTAINTDTSGPGGGIPFVELSSLLIELGQREDQLKVEFDTLSRYHYVDWDEDVEIRLDGKAKVLWQLGRAILTELGEAQQDASDAVSIFDELIP